LVRREEGKVVSAGGRHALPVKPTRSPRRRLEATNVDLMDLIDQDEITATSFRI
jgi:hypothetical protein